MRTVGDEPSVEQADAPSTEQVIAPSVEQATKPVEKVAVEVEPKPAPPSEPTSEPAGDWSTYEATAYTAQCDGCSGITKTGVDVRSTIYHEGKRVIAVDPSRIKLGSSVEVRLSDGSSFEAIAADVGGAIKGGRIDLLVSDKDTAYSFGRQSVEVRKIQ